MTKNDHDYFDRHVSHDNEQFLRLRLFVYVSHETVKVNLSKYPMQVAKRDYEKPPNVPAQTARPHDLIYIGPQAQARA